VNECRFTFSSELIPVAEVGMYYKPTDI